jgi:hypothetical protein
MPRRYTIQRFTGIDRRRDRSLADENTMWRANNLSLSVGGTLRSRPGTAKIAQLPSESVGLFAANGSLQTVAPAGHLDLYRRIPYVLTNFIGDGTIYERDSLQALEGAEVYGASAIEATPYLAIRVTRGGATSIEHHYIVNRPDTGEEAVDTRVVLPFIPTGGLEKLEEKLWTPDQATGVVRFSSTVKGPSNWTELADAGFIPVLNNIGGSRTITGVIRYRRWLAVFFGDAVQIWSVAPNPDNIYSIETLEGVGTTVKEALTNVRGDVFFVSRGGISSLSAATSVASSQELNVGAPVLELTEAETATQARAIYFPATSQYLVAFGSTVYAFTASPYQDVRGWTTWTLPFSVEQWAINDGVLHARGTDHGVYRFDFDSSADSSVPFTWTWQTQAVNGGDPFRRKQFRTLHLVQDGKTDLSIAVNPRDPDTFATVGVQEGDSDAFGQIPLFATSEAVSLQGAGTGSYELTGIALEAEVL